MAPFTLNTSPYKLWKLGGAQKKRLQLQQLLCIHTKTVDKMKLTPTIKHLVIKW
jgi:hypothetical protein